ncbi:hypothetical protein BJP34_28820 [Moorena producens PAL-8-15-08-1]|uniref:Uncharacterized protein n=1 Tax=Moorena producens PAL-8-15-08-1 TaxID=1458985 RepID=A0A1D8TZ37_9CYAN|nr:hypothetical protein BJP34_28820 [Moorena producens PAL-8-15-08-1]
MEPSAPRDSVELQLAQIWSEILGLTSPRVETAWILWLAHRKRVETAFSLSLSTDSYIPRIEKYTCGLTWI